MKSAAPLLLALVVSACGGTATPYNPSATPPVTPGTLPAPTGSIVSGRVTAVNGGQGLGAVAVGLGDRTVMTDGAGSYTFPALPSGGGSFRVTLTAAGILPRSLTAASVRRAR